MLMTNSSLLDEVNPEIDAFDALRRISMGMVASGHDRLGVCMLDALRSHVATPSDIDASIALAELARGDVRQARQRVERDILLTQPTHSMSLLIKAICDRADGRDYWRRGPQAVLSTSNSAQWRQLALDMLSVNR
jgi:hypothetical protein